MVKATTGMNLGANISSLMHHRKLYCFDLSGTVDIAMGESGVAATKPVTIPEYYQSTFDKMPDKKALCWKDNKDGPWKNLTYGEYRKLIYLVAKSLLKVCISKATMPRARNLIIYTLGQHNTL